MNSPTSYDQIIQESSHEERQVVALEEQAGQQRRVADALEVLANSAKLDRHAELLAELGELSQRGLGLNPDGQSVWQQHWQAREAVREHLTGVPSLWR